MEINHRNREKESLKSLMIHKYEYLKDIDSFTVLIDEKAKEINLTPMERTEMILEVKKEMK